MIVGAVVVIGWKNLFADTGVYEIIPGFILAFISIIVVSLLTKAPNTTVTGRFEKQMNSTKKAYNLLNKSRGFGLYLFLFLILIFEVSFYNLHDWITTSLFYPWQLPQHLPAIRLNSSILPLRNLIKNQSHRSPYGIQQFLDSEPQHQ